MSIVKKTAATRLSTRDVRRIGDELAKAAGLTRDEALRVLDVLHVKQLVSNANTVQRLLSSDGNVAALGLSQEHAAERIAVSSAEALTLDNLRIGIKAKDLSSIIV